mmetsp:Transcript_29205/g.27974  ORF Transcript_29205/g.27974 Transcript_29205/m.27974 type:complete len:397 (-) Transcript_29205:216-1406(-)
MEQYHKGNALFVDEFYEEAVENYCLAVQSLPDFAPALNSRAAAYLKLKKYNQALQDCNNAIILDATLESAYYKKGLVCFELEEFETSRKSFETALLSKCSEKNVLICNRWIRKCDVEIQELDKEIPQISRSTVPSSSSATAPVAIPSKAPPINVSLHTKSAIVPSNPIRYQYYQGNDSLNISVLAKNMLPGDVDISIESDHLRVVCTGEVVIDKLLYALVNTEKSKFEIRKSKVEIILWKIEQSIWPSIEGDGSIRLKPAAPAVISPIDGTGDMEGDKATDAKRPHPYASQRDWDAVGSEISKELEAEKPEGEEALQKLFKDIYGKADSATQRAMNKSFQTSGGTVLSTNWGEVSKKDYEDERQAPKGVEWKSWEGKKLKQEEDEENNRTSLGMKK